MSEMPGPNQTIELEPDDPPKSGRWVDACDVIANPTPEEMEAGVALGEEIDPDDDEDAGALLLRAVASSERDRALAKARVLKKTMLAYGVPQVSIELQAGRPSSHGVFDALFVVNEMSHHTVSRFQPGVLTPVLALCKSGRSDLPGPLCNGYGGYDLTYRIMTFGYANHPGFGGPMRVPAFSGGTFLIPKDSARRYSWGTEWEGGLNAADWDRELRNPRTGDRMTMREFMGRSNAALREYHKIISHMEHSTWAFGRKIDRLGYTAAEGTAELKRYTKEERILPENRETVQQWVRNTPITIKGKDDKPVEKPLQAVLADLEETQERVLRRLDEIKSRLPKDPQ